MLLRKNPYVHSVYSHPSHAESGHHILQKKTAPEGLPTGDAPETAKAEQKEKPAGDHPGTLQGEKHEGGADEGEAREHAKVSILIVLLELMRAMLTTGFVGRKGP